MNEKRMIRACLLAIGMMLLGVVARGEVPADISKRWFDYDNCDFCKHWAAQPGLIEHSYDECHNLSNGIIWVTAIDVDYRGKFRKAQVAEEQVASDQQAGKNLAMCAYCNGLTEFGSRGVKIEGVSAAAADITLYTSTDSSLVKELQLFGQQAIAELRKANAAFVAIHPERK